MKVIFEDCFGEDNEIIYKEIIICATVTLELSTQEFIGMHFTPPFGGFLKIPGIVELVKKDLDNRPIKNLYLALVMTNWKEWKNWKYIEEMKTSFKVTGKYLINELADFGDDHNLCFKFEHGSAVITDNGKSITGDFQDWDW